MSSIEKPKPVLNVRITVPEGETTIACLPMELIVEKIFMHLRDEDLQTLALVCHVFKDASVECARRRYEGIYSIAIKYANCKSEIIDQESLPKCESLKEIKKKYYDDLAKVRIYHPPIYGNFHSNPLMLQLPYLLLKRGLPLEAEQMADSFDRVLVTEAKHNAKLNGVTSEFLRQKMSFKRYLIESYVKSGKLFKAEDVANSIPLSYALDKAAAYIPVIRAWEERNNPKEAERVTGDIYINLKSVSRIKNLISIVKFWRCYTNRKFL